MGRRRALRIFLSHTAELARYPAERSFVRAAEDAVTRVGHVIVECGRFPARDEAPAAVCRAEVAEADVLVVVAGFHYGTPVREQPDLSYVELEYQAAGDAGIPRLAFLLDVNAEGPAWLFLDHEHGRRQEEFRARLCAAGVVETVRTPDGLTAALLHALADLRGRETEVETRTEVGPPGVTDEVFAATYRSFTAAALNGFEFFGVDPRGGPRRHPFDHGYVAPTLVPHQPTSDGPASVGERADRALAKTRRALLRGTAGSGKSTLLRWLGWQAAASPATDGNAPVPFVVELGRYGGAPPDLEQLVDPRLHAEMPADWVRRMLDAGRVLLLLDGLDEVPVPERADVGRWLEGYLYRYPGVRCVLSTRPSVLAEQPWVDAGFQQSDLLEMSRYNVERFVRGWHDVAGADYRSDSSSDREAREWLARSADDLLRTLNSRPALGGMSANPLLCGLLCALHRDSQHLPENRKDVYDAAFELLMVRWPSRRRPRSDGAQSDRGGVPAPDSGPTSIRMNVQELQQLLQRLAFWMVTNGKLVLDHEVAPRRVRSGMRGLREDDPDRVLQYLTQDCGLLRELPDRSLLFLHRTFRDYLAAKEVFDEDSIDQMLEHAHRPDWHDVVVMAGAHARPRERAEILARLVSRSAAEPANRESLVLLARAILDQATVLPSDRLDIRALVDGAVRGLIPPQSTRAADRLADVGLLVLDLLPEPDRCTDDEQVLLVRTLAGIAAGPDRADAVPQINRFLRPARRLLAKRMIEQLLIVWGRRGDYESYARDVLGKLPLGGIRVSLQSPGRIPHVHYLDTVTHLILQDETGSLAPVAAMRRLRGLTLVRNEQVQLDQLAGARSLRTLELDSCSAVVGSRPIDLAPVVGMSLRRLKISGLWTKVDLTSLAGARLHSLSLGGSVLRGDVVLPVDLEVRHLTALTRGRGTLDLSRVRGLRSVIIDRDLADDERAALHERHVRVVVLPRG